MTPRQIRRFVCTCAFHGRARVFQSRCGIPARKPLANAVGYVQFYSRSHHAVIRVYDEAGNVIETHEHEGTFKEP
jgi:hypothetical protein